MIQAAVQRELHEQRAGGSPCGGARRLRERSLAPRERSLAPRERSLAPRERSLAPRERSLAPRQRSSAPRERHTGSARPARAGQRRCQRARLTVSAFAARCLSVCRSLPQRLQLAASAFAGRCLSVAARCLSAYGSLTYE